MRLNTDWKEAAPGFLTQDSDISHRIVSFSDSHPPASSYKDLCNYIGPTQVSRDNLPILASLT